MENHSLSEISIVMRIIWGEWFQICLSVLDGTKDFAISIPDLQDYLENPEVIIETDPKHKQLVYFLKKKISIKSHISSWANRKTILAFMRRNNLKQTRLSLKWILMIGRVRSNFKRANQVRTSKKRLVQRRRKKNWKKNQKQMIKKKLNLLKMLKKWVQGMVISENSDKWIVFLIIIFYFIKSLIFFCVCHQNLKNFLCCLLCGNLRMLTDNSINKLNKSSVVAVTILKKLANFSRFIHVSFIILYGAFYFLLSLHSLFFTSLLIFEGDDNWWGKLMFVDF